MQQARALFHCAKSNYCVSNGARIAHATHGKSPPGFLFALVRASVCAGEVCPTLPFIYTPPPLSEQQ